MKTQLVSTEYLNFVHKLMWREKEQFMLFDDLPKRPLALVITHPGAGAAESLVISITTAYFRKADSSG